MVFIWHGETFSDKFRMIEIEVIIDIIEFVSSHCGRISDTAGNVGQRRFDSDLSEIAFHLFVYLNMTVKHKPDPHFTVDLFRIKSFEFDLEGAAVAEFELFAVVHEIFPSAPPIFLDGGQYGLECAIKANMAA